MASTVVRWRPSGSINVGLASQRRISCSCIKLSFQRLAHAFRDHGRIVVDGERYCALESVPAGNEYAGPALEWVGGDPPFVWRAGVLAAGDYYRRLDTLAAVAWDPLMSKTVSGIRRNCMRS